MFRLPQLNTLREGPSLRRYEKGRYFELEDLHVRIPKLDGLSPEVSLRRISELLNRPMTGGRSPAWWIGVGTALGFEREKSFVEGDTDIDVRIGLDYAGNDAALEMAKELRGLLEANSLRLVRETYWGGLVMQTAFADDTNEGIIIDLYYFYRGIFDGCYVNFNDRNYRCKPEEFVANRQLANWPGTDISVYVPHPIRGYLEWRFGPEWEVKKSNEELGPVDNACLRPLPETTVLTYGTFDILHRGHESLLERAKGLGDQLIVGIVSDELCRVKGKEPWQNEAMRAAAVAQLPYVDAVFVQRQLDQKEFDTDRFGASYLVVGDDWKDHPRFEAVRGYHGLEIVYLPRTPGISSTSIKQSITG